jgi:hypothetical protein
MKEAILLTFLLFAIPRSNAANPFRNAYLKQSLQYVMPDNGTADLFERNFALPQKSRANVIVTNGLLLAAGIVAVNPSARKKFKDRWELITSPNHASPLNQGPFHFRTLDEERSQNTQADKGVHFAYHYLPVKPISFVCEYLIDGLPFIADERAKQEEWVSDEAFYLATILVFAGGFFEEYVDGKEIDEGFSIGDFIANSAGSIYAVLKHEGLCENVYMYWSYRAPQDDWQWPWWDYMPGFEFRAIFDLSPLLFKKEREAPELFYWWTENLGYLPDVDGFSSSKPHWKPGPDID